MCDDIKITYDSIKPNGDCLCNESPESILLYIVCKLDIHIGDTIQISRTPFGWEAEKIGERHSSQENDKQDIEEAQESLKELNSMSLADFKDRAIGTVPIEETKQGLAGYCQPPMLHCKDICSTCRQDETTCKDA